MSSPPLTARPFELPLQPKQDQSAAATRTRTASVSLTASSQKAAKRAATRMTDQAVHKIRGLDANQEHTGPPSPTHHGGPRSLVDFAATTNTTSSTRPSHSPINVTAAMSELSTAMRSDIADAPPLPVPAASFRPRPMPTIPPAQLASLVRSHVRNVGFTARLKTKMQVRELREEQKDQKIRVTERARAIPLPAGAIPPTSARQPAAAAAGGHQEEKTAHSSPAPHRFSSSSSIHRPPARGFDDLTSMAARLGLGPIHPLTGIHEAMVQPSAHEPVIPWPSWSTAEVAGGLEFQRHEEEEDEAPIWRDQLGNSLGIESAEGRPSKSKKKQKATTGSPLVDGHSIRMPPIQPPRSARAKAALTHSRGLRGSFAPIANDANAKRH